MFMNLFRLSSTELSRRLCTQRIAELNCYVLPEIVGFKAPTESTPIAWLRNEFAPRCWNPTQGSDMALSGMSPACREN